MRYFHEYIKPGICAVEAGIYVVFKASTLPKKELYSTPVGTFVKQFKKTYSAIDELIPSTSLFESITK